jgi:hypothetical protein
MRHRVLLIIVVAVVPRLASAQSDLPPFVSQLIARPHTGIGAVSAPGSVWRYRYRGRVVYYVLPRSCCDLMSRLYDAEGNLMCRPNGGIAGGGDGKCTDFSHERSEEQLLWSAGAG